MNRLRKYEKHLKDLGTKLVEGGKITNFEMDRKRALYILHVDEMSDQELYSLIEEIDIIAPVVRFVIDRDRDSGKITKVVVFISSPKKH